MRSLAVLVALTAAADATPLVEGAAQLHYELTSLHDVDHPAGEPASPQDLILAAARLHGFVGKRHVAYHVGLDLAAGQTARPHSWLAYDVVLYPVGLAVRFGTTSFLSVGGGIGAQGALHTLDDALTFPVEARLELGRADRVLARARVTFMSQTMRERELEGMLGVRLGHAYRGWGTQSGDGYFVGVSTRSAGGSRFIGVTVGFAIDATGGQ